MDLVFRTLSFLPLWLLHGIGVLVGHLVYWGSPTYRRNLRANLRQALGDGATPALARQVAGESGKTMMEMPIMWCSSTAKVAALVREVKGWEVAEAAQARGDGLLFLTPHLGCFEIVGQYIASRLPIAVLYRKPKQVWLDRLMRNGRDRSGMQAWPADLSGVRALMKSLRRSEAVGLLPDQAPKAGEGIWSPFFGRPAFTMTLAARLSASAAQVVFVWAERLPAGRGYRLRFSLPPQALTGDVPARAAQINLAVEALIRSCPQQYMWGYKRYKQPLGAPPAPPWPDGSADLPRSPATPVTDASAGEVRE